MIKHLPLPPDECGRPTLTMLAAELGELNDGFRQSYETTDEPLVKAYVARQYWLLQWARQIIEQAAFAQGLAAECKEDTLAKRSELLTYRKVHLVKK
jgi:hypothetical protein